MVKIELPDVPPFCIDTTEVTQGQYAAFLADKTVNPSTQTRDICRTNNLSFVPPVTQPDSIDGCPSGTYDPEKKADLPMSCVDFCDAVAFCEWSGRRLCGSVDGGSLEDKEPSDSRKSQWYLACSQGGKHKYPYGDTFEPGTCDTGGKEVELRPATESVCAAPNAPFDRVRDLSGSVSEWEDWMKEGVAAGLRGTYSSSMDTGDFACGARNLTGAWGVGAANPGTGFRCCADLPTPQRPPAARRSLASRPAEGEPPPWSEPYALPPGGPAFGPDNDLLCPGSSYNPEKHGNSPVVSIGGCAARA